MCPKFDYILYLNTIFIELAHKMNIFLAIEDLPAIGGISWKGQDHRPAPSDLDPTQHIWGK